MISSTSSHTKIQMRLLSLFVQKLIMKGLGVPCVECFQSLPQVAKKKGQMTNATKEKKLVKKNRRKMIHQTQIALHIDLSIVLITAALKKIKCILDEY